MTNKYNRLFTLKNTSSRVDFSLPAKQAAFTLAEVLITLGIIGVVAALTIPGLINNYKARSLRAQFLKSYSTVQQVFKQMEADDVSLDPTTYSGGTLHDMFLNYLKGITDCGKSQNGSNKKFSPCYNYKNTEESYESLNGQKLSYMWFDDGQIILPDGSLLLFENPNQSGGVNYYAWVFVDLNGHNNPPNKLGYDLFAFEFLDGELRTMGDTKTKYNDMSKYCNFENSSNGYNGLACAQKAKENPDYFKEIVRGIK